MSLRTRIKRCLLKKNFFFFTLLQVQEKTIHKEMLVIAKPVFSFFLTGQIHTQTIEHLTIFQT